jgi:hypothetical protein
MVPAPKSGVMKASNQVALAATSALALQLTACEAVKFVFKTGFWVGALVVVALVVGIGLVLRAIG